MRSYEYPEPMEILGGSTESSHPDRPPSGGSELRRRTKMMKRESRSLPHCPSGGKRRVKS
jgi:hypothetical protein